MVSTDIIKTNKSSSDHWSPNEDKLLLSQIFKNNGKN